MNALSYAAPARATTPSTQRVRSKPALREYPGEVLCSHTTRDTNRSLTVAAPKKQGGAFGATTVRER